MSGRLSGYVVKSMSELCEIAPGASIGFDVGRITVLHIVQFHADGGATSSFRLSGQRVLLLFMCGLIYSIGRSTSLLRSVAANSALINKH